MSSSKENKGDLAGRVNFPVYTLKMLNERQFVVAGGGGAAKTGVANGFAFFQLGFNGEHCVATEIGRHNTGSKAVMNCSSFFDPKTKKCFLVGGQDGHSQLYSVIQRFETARSLSFSDQNENDKAAETNVRKRKNTGGKEGEKENDEAKDESKGKTANGLFNQKQLRVFAVPMDSIQTDMSEPKEEAFQKVVRISLTGKLMATGGADGYLRLWQFPSLKPLREIKAHEKEVDDVDFSPDSQKVVSISRDSCAYIWNVKDGKKLCQLEWNTPNKAKYLFKRCRFAQGEEGGQRSRLFTAVNPASQSKLPSFVQRWDTSTFLLAQSVPVSSAISALATSPCGKFVATGSMFGGDVTVYVAFNLQCLRQVQGAHSTFVTGLDFVPCSTESGRAVTGQSEAAVISVSVDNLIRVHRISPPRFLPVWAAALLIVIVLVFTFILCSYVGL